MAEVRRFGQAELVVVGAAHDRHRVFGKLLFSFALNGLVKLAAGLSSAVAYCMSMSPCLKYAEIR